MLLTSHRQTSRLRDKIMKVSQTLSLISATNQLTPEQTQIFEKALRKLDAGRSMDEVIEYLRQNDYPLTAEDGDTLDEETPKPDTAEPWDEEFSQGLLDELFGEVMDTQPEVAKDFIRRMNAALLERAMNGDAGARAAACPEAPPEASVKASVSADE
jgi:hypothetical protein